MKRMFLVMAAFFTFAIGTAAWPPAVAAQGDAAISATVVGEGIFITVRESEAGEMVSLYRIRGDRIVLVDTVINSVSKNTRDIRVTERYLHHLGVENR